MAAVGILMMGIGGWLMYEAYKGNDISAIKSKVTGITQTAVNPVPPGNPQHLRLA